MTIQSKTWRRFVYVGSILALPCTIDVFWEPDFGSVSVLLERFANMVIVSFAVAGALLAILTRTGHVKIIYRDEDKGSWIFRFEKEMAETASNRGYPFAKQYYESLDVNPPEKASVTKDSLL